MKEAHQQLAEKIMWLEWLETAAFFLAFVFFVAAVVIFVKWKIYHAVNYLSGHKRSREIKRLKRFNSIFMASVVTGTAAAMMAAAMGTPHVLAQEKDVTEERAEIFIKPMAEKIKKEGVFWYDTGVYVSVILPEKYMEAGEIRIYARPMDETAERSAGETDYIDNKGNVDIPGWFTVEESGQKELRFSYKEQGKWKICVRAQSVDKGGGEDVTDGTESAEAGEEEPGDISLPEITEAESEAFVLDCEAPVLNVKYIGYRDISTNTSEPEHVNRRLARKQKKITSSDNEIFAKKGGQIIFEIKEEYFFPEDSRLAVYEKNYETKENREVTSEIMGKAQWKKEKSGYRLYCIPEREGHFYFQIEYRDVVGHGMTASKGSETGSCMTEEGYRSPVYTIDMTPPVLKKIIYETESKNTQGERRYFSNHAEILLEIEEENFNQEDFSLEDMLTQADGKLMRPSADETDYSLLWLTAYENGKRVNRARIVISEQGNHTFFVEATDGCGWKSGKQQAECTLDEEKPKVEIKLKGHCYYAPYRSFQYFSKDKICFTVTATDNISGIKDITFYDTKDSSEKGKLYSGKKINEKRDVKKNNLSQYTMEFIIDKEDFKGKIHVETEDYAGNRGDERESPGLLVETEAVHKRNSGILWKFPEAAFTDEENKIKYYNCGIAVGAHLTESHSGLREGSIKAYISSGGTQEQAKTVSGDAGKGGERRKVYSREADIVYEDDWSLWISKEKCVQSEAANPVCIEARWKSNSGYERRQAYKDYKIVIDAEKPVIAVDYNTGSAANESYYRQTRIATVTVKDKNFNPSSVKWFISGSNNKYKIGEWTGGGEIHRCKIRFFSDGEDYKIKLSAADYAGNRSLWDKDSAFTVDKTPPVLHMKMDTGDSQNEKYYAKPKKVYFRVEDKNIDCKKSAYYLNEKGKEKKLVLLRGRNEIYITEQLFSKEGEYGIIFRCVDLAGNRAEYKERLNFIIDRTKPVLEMKGIKEGKAITGEIYPQIVIKDNYLNIKTVHAVIARADGGKTKVKKIKALRENNRGAELRENCEIHFKWENIPCKKENDGIYILKAYGKDLAGNEVSLGEGLTIILNRFGASYQQGKTLKEIIKNGYMNKEDSLVLKELSVQDTDTTVTIVKDNEEVIQDVSSYILKESLSAQEGTKGWKEKEIKMKKENFQEEGMYRITVESKGIEMENGQKRIVNATNNDEKNTPIFFTVDKTPPVVKIGGLEEEFYKAEKHTVIMTVMDNYELKDVKLRIHYEGGRRKDREFYFSAADFSAAHSIPIELDSYNGRQSISWQASDRAGNVGNSNDAGESVSCVITENQIVQAYYRGSWFSRVAAGIVFILILTAGGIFTLRRLRRQIDFD